MAIEYINAQGEPVDEGAPDTAYQVNSNDPKKQEFIDGIKRQATLSNGPLASAVVSALEVAPETGNPTTLEGIDKRALEGLRKAGLDTLGKIAGATDDELNTVPYVTDKVLAQLRERTRSATAGTVSLS